MTQRKLDELFSCTKKRSIRTDEFDDLFENPSTSKRRRINDQSTDVFDFLPSKKKRTDEDDQIFNDDMPKKLRRAIKTEDVFDGFPIQSSTITPKKVKMFFDLEPMDDENKEYTQIKPVLIIGGQWLSKSGETKSVDDSTDIPFDERNLMHIQYATLTPEAKSIPGKSFQKQTIPSDASIVRKENLRSCYNALLEDVNKARNSSTIEEEKQFDFFDLSTRRKKR